MRRLLVAVGALALGALLVPGEAAAQRIPRLGGSHGGFHGATGAIGGFRGGAIAMRPGGFPAGAASIRPGLGPGFRAGLGGYRPAPLARPAFRYGYRPGVGPYRPWYRPYYGWRYPYYRRAYGWSYPYYGWGYPYSDDWGWGAAGLVVGTAIGAAAAAPYPVYAAPAPSIGGYCATPVRTCALIEAAPIGTGCSCRTKSGRARGTVVGP